MDDLIAARIICLDEDGKKLVTMLMDPGPRSTYKIGARLQIQTDAIDKVFIVEGCVESDDGGDDVLVVTLRIAKDQGPVRLM